MCDSYASADMVNYIGACEILILSCPIRMIIIDFFALYCISLFRSLMYCCN
jgi:hypothetical protein